MAQPPVEDDLDLKPAKAGVLFRAEMFTSNVLLGYWRVFVSVLVVVLLSILLFGQYRTWNRRSQRQTSAEAAQLLAALPAPVEALPGSLASGETDAATLGATADRIVAVAASGRGTARTEAYLLASELYRIAKDTEKQRSALAAAAESARGVLSFAAEEGLANIDLAGGQGEEAVARLRKLAGGEDGFHAEQAMLDLGLALEHLGRKDEAAKVYDDFVARFPESPRKEDVEERQARLGQGQGIEEAG